MTEKKKKKKMKRMRKTSLPWCMRRTLHTQSSKRKRRCQTSNERK